MQEEAMFLLAVDRILESNYRIVVRDDVKAHARTKQILIGQEVISEVIREVFSITHVKIGFDVNINRQFSKLPDRQPAQLQYLGE